MNDKVKDCVICYPELIPEQKMIFSNEHCAFFQIPQKILLGSGIIVPNNHKNNVFELSEEEFISTFKLLSEVKSYLDEKHNPDGYNIVWNTNSAAGQHLFHAHLHVIPRFNNEPLTGQHLHTLICTDENKRTNSRTNSRCKTSKRGF